MYPNFLKCVNTFPSQGTTFSVRWVDDLGGHWKCKGHTTSNRFSCSILIAFGIQFIWIQIWNVSLSVFWWLKKLKKNSATSWNWPILFPFENRKQKKQHSPKYCHQFSNIFIMISFSPHWLTVLIFTQNIKCSENSHSSFSAIDIW